MRVTSSTHPRVCHPTRAGLYLKPAAGSCRPIPVQSLRRKHRLTTTVKTLSFSTQDSPLKHSVGLLPLGSGINRVPPESFLPWGGTVRCSWRGSLYKECCSRLAKKKRLFFFVCTATRWHRLFTPPISSNVVTSFFLLDDEAFGYLKHFKPKPTPRSRERECVCGLSGNLHGGCSFPEVTLLSSRMARPLSRGDFSPLGRQLSALYTAAKKKVFFLLLLLGINAVACAG